MLPFWPFKKKKLKVGLVLGGGVARAIAHIGVLKVLEAHQIPIHLIVGTSAGALVGAAYASGMNPDLIERIAMRMGWARLLRITFSRTGPVSPQALQEFIAQHLGKETFSELKIPFAAVACDLRSGKEIILTDGSVSKAVAASCAFPGIITPIEWGGKLLVDGGTVNNLPVEIARKLGANIIIAVDVVPSYSFKTDPKDIFQVLGRSLDLILHKASIENRDAADYLIEPYIIEGIWHLDVNRGPELIKAGEDAAARVVIKIKKKLKNLLG